MTLEVIPDFVYFIFNIILFWKNIHLLLLYPKHVIKLLGYNLGCYISHIHEERNNLRKMFTSSDWIESKWTKEQKGKNVANIIFMPYFWNTKVFFVWCQGPLVRVLRLVDCEKRPLMGYIYKALKKAEEMIVTSFNRSEEKYREIMEIIDRRWEV